jgi:hypothetical protein
MVLRPAAVRTVVMAKTGVSNGVSHDPIVRLAYAPEEFSVRDLGESVIAYDRIRFHTFAFEPPASAVLLAVRAHGSTSVARLRELLRRRLSDDAVTQALSELADSGVLRIDAS